MKWGSLVASLLSIVALRAPVAESIDHSTWTSDRKVAAREATRELWQHGFDSYMDHAFPLDELKPISCTGQGPDWKDPTAIHLNDVNANVSLTLIDNLDSFIVLSNRTGFSAAVYDVISHVSFNVNTKPQVFEITIRALGGLLSGHLFAEDKENKYGFRVEGYKGELLELARDLGERLLPAFETATGIPYARINLRHGVVKNESPETCAAGAGSLLLEFTTLSRWTNDPRFEQAARRAFFAVWNRRSKLGLLGNGINVKTGTWIEPSYSGIGAGIDSFYEYALKMYVMTGEKQYLDVWNDAYYPLMKYSRGLDGFWYRTVGMGSGEMAMQHIDSLGAFWPGLQVLAGDVESAIKSHLAYWNLWKRYSGIPETFNVLTRQAISLGYPIRPEFIESTYFLYRATHDSFYLDVGLRVLEDLTRRTKVPCGLATISNLLTNTHEDRMESFALSETLKYLYLLFDEDNFINKNSDSSFVFTTEGHILPLLPTPLSPGKALPTRPMYSTNHTLLDLDPLITTTPHFDLRDKLQCPVYEPLLSPKAGSPSSTVRLANDHLTGSIRDRPDFEYARMLTGISTSADRVLGVGFPRSKGYDTDSKGPTPTAGSPLKKELSIVTQDDVSWWRADGWCNAERTEEYILEWIISPDGRFVLEDNTPSPSKVTLFAGGLIIHNITGLRLTASARADRSGYDVVQIGPYEVKAGQTVFIRDPTILAHKMAQDDNLNKATAFEPRNRPYPTVPDIFLRISHPLPAAADYESQEAVIRSLPADVSDMPIYKNKDDEFGFVIDTIASTATFGGNPALEPKDDLKVDQTGDGWSMTRPAPLLFGPSSPYNGAIRLIRAEPHNANGCEDHHPGLRYGYLTSPQMSFQPKPSVSSTEEESDNAPDHRAPPATVLLVRRGGCTFFRKLVAAKEVGFVGVVVWNAQDEPNDTTLGGLVNPSADPDEQEYASRELGDVSIVFLAREDGRYVDAMMTMAEVGRETGISDGEVLVEVFRDPPPALHDEPVGESTVPVEAGNLESEPTLDEILLAGATSDRRILYINGLALKNTILY